MLPAVHMHARRKQGPSKAGPNVGLEQVLNLDASCQASSSAPAALMIADHVHPRIGTPGQSFTSIGTATVKSGYPSDSPAPKAASHGHDELAGRHRLAGLNVGPAEDCAAGAQLRGGAYVDGLVGQVVVLAVEDHGVPEHDAAAVADGAVRVGDPRLSGPLGVQVHPRADLDAVAAQGVDLRVRQQGQQLECGECKPRSWQSAA